MPLNAFMYRMFSMYSWSFICQRKMRKYGKILDSKQKRA